MNAGKLDLTQHQLGLLRHMLGIEAPNDRVPRPCRDYAAVAPGDPEFVELERLGAVRRYATPRPGMPYDLYCTTDAGRAAALRSHRTIRRRKSERVYARYLDVADAVPDLGFRRFLTDPRFKRARAEA